jgi:hypothetical protein
MPRYCRLVVVPGNTIDVYFNLGLSYTPSEHNDQAAPLRKNHYADLWRSIHEYHPRATCASFSCAHGDAHFMAGIELCMAGGLLVRGTRCILVCIAPM